MRLFLKKLVLFSIIYLLYLIAAVWIDPFDIIHKEKNPRQIERESQISYHINQQLYKLQMYIDQPADVILLGDSRTRALDSSLFENLTRMSTANLAYGAASISDIVDTFWYVNNVHKVKEVYIGINFNLFNDYNRSSEVQEAIKLMESPQRYLFSKYCYKSLYLIIKSLVTGSTIEISKPDMTKEEFWDFQADSTAAIFYRNYKYPYSYQKDLTEIKSYCKDNDIKLVFFIPPTHTDLQKRVIDFGLVEEEIAFKAFLHTLGTTYDFDTPNDLTRSYDNFTDPFHFNDSIANIIIKKIVADN